MTQNRYHPEAEIVYRRHRSGPLPAHRPGPQTYAIPQRPPPSMNQAEADKANPRKRIAVACSRCRKRKIKCSGDRGDGQGCTNCKNSSNGGSGQMCQFLRVSSQDLGSLYPDVSPMIGSPAAYAVPPDMSYYSPSYYQQHGMQTSHSPRVPRHYVSNVNYSPVAMMTEPSVRHGDPVMEGFPYSNSSHQAYYQQSMYNQPDQGHYYAQNFNYSRQPMETDSFRYSNMPLNHASGPTVSDGHSSFSSMDSLAHSLPVSSAAQRTLPNPRGSISTLGDGSEQMGQLQQPLQPVLKSQGVGSLGSFPSTTLPPPVNSEAPSSDTVSAQSQPQPDASQHIQQPSSLKSNASDRFPSFSFATGLFSSSGTSVSGEQDQSITADMGALGTSNAGTYDGQMYRSSFAFDARMGSTGRSGSSSNTSSVQYTLASSDDSKRGSQASLFGPYDDGNASCDGKANSAASGGNSAVKKWDS